MTDKKDDVVNIERDPEEVFKDLLALISGLAKKADDLKTAGEKACETLSEMKEYGDAEKEAAALYLKTINNVDDKGQVRGPIAGSDGKDIRAEADRDYKATMAPFRVKLAKAVADMKETQQYNEAFRDLNSLQESAVKLARNTMKKLIVSGQGWANIKARAKKFGLQEKQMEGLFTEWEEHRASIEKKNIPAPGELLRQESRPNGVDVETTKNAE